MGSRQVGRVALMSIHPQYAQAILNGTKKVEFRKRPIAADVRHVVIYATAPISAIVGVFSVTEQTTTSPRCLWTRFQKVAGIAHDGFNDYYAGRDLATGIGIGQVTTLAEPLYLEEHLGISRPPQSYRYLERSMLPKALLSAATS